MLNIRLRTFLIISSVLHIVAIFIVAVFFHTEGIITKPKLVNVGVINEYKNLGVGSGKSLEPTLKEALKPGKEVAKRIAERVRGISKTKEIVNQVNESVDEKSTTDLNQNREGEQINETASTKVAGIGSYAGTGSSEGKGAVEGSGLDAEGSGQGGERVGYPDYKINPKPSYPMIARRSGYEGVVLLRVFVLENGKVGKIELEKSSGYGILDKSALDAVKDWVFIPGKRAGASISSWVTVPIRFELSSG